MEFLRQKDVTKKMKIGKTFLYDMIKKGMFPKPIKVSQISLWVDSDIEKIMTALCRGFDEENLKAVVREIENNRLQTSFPLAEQSRAWPGQRTAGQSPYSTGQVD